MLALFAPTQPPMPSDPAGASSTALIRWLKITGNLLCELNFLDVVGAGPFPESDRVKRAGQAFQRKILAALPSLAASLSADVRRHAAS